MQTMAASSSDRARALKRLAQDWKELRALNAGSLNAEPVNQENLFLWHANLTTNDGFLRCACVLCVLYVCVRRSCVRLHALLKYPCLGDCRFTWKFSSPKATHQRPRR